MRKFLRRHPAVVAVFLALPSSAIGMNCGDLPGKPGISGHFVSLPPPPSKPFFYYRLGDYIVLVNPQAIRQQLNVWTGGGPKSETMALRSRLLASLPLRDDNDLYRFTLQDADFWYPTRSLVISLLEAGKAAVSYAVVDDPLQRVYVEDYRQADMAATTIRLDKAKGSYELMRLVECIAN